MSVVEENEEQPVGVETKVPHLRLVTGGKGPPDPPDSDNWLANLSPGHTFCCRQTLKTVDFEVFSVLHQQPGLTLLKWHVPDGKYWDRHVDPKIFSNLYKDHKILGYVNIEEVLKQRNTNGNSDGESDRAD